MRSQVPRKPDRRVAPATERRRGSSKEAKLPLLAVTPEKTLPTSITYQKKCKNDTFLPFLTKCKQRRHPKTVPSHMPHCSHFSPKKYFLHGVGSNKAPPKDPLTPTSFWRQKLAHPAEFLSGLKSRGSRRLTPPPELKTHDEFDRQRPLETSPAWSKSNLKTRKSTSKRRVTGPPRFESSFLKLRKPLV